jgi:hypothetical protein
MSGTGSIMSNRTQTISHDSVNELLAHVLAADDALASPDWVSEAEIVERVWLCVYALGLSAGALGLDKLSRLSRELSVTLSALAHTRGPVCADTLDHIERGVIVLGVMVRDLERQLDGHAPAALDDAIDALMDMRRDYLRRGRTA